VRLQYTTRGYFQNVKENDDSFTSGLIYDHGDDGVDDDGDVPPRTPIELRNGYDGVPDDCNNTIFDVRRGRGRSRGGNGRGLARGRGCGHGGGAPVLDDDNTVRKVAFPPDTTLWSEYVSLSDHIHKDNHVTMFNWMPPQDAMKDGKIVAGVDKRGTLAHKNKYDVNFEYSFSSRCF
jgi:hypothetical protein